jgi:hypothetical protein
MHCAPNGFEGEGVVVVDKKLEGEMGEALGVQVADADVLLTLPKKKTCRPPPSLLQYL